MKKDATTSPPRFVYGRVDGFPCRIFMDTSCPAIMRSLHTRFAPDGLLEAIWDIEESAPSTPADFLAHVCNKGFTPDASAERHFQHVIGWRRFLKDVSFDPQSIKSGN